MTSDLVIYRDASSWHRLGHILRSRS